MSATAEAEPKKLDSLALVCQAARLTSEMSEATRLSVDGLTTGQISRHLSVPYRETRTLIHTAADRMADLYRLRDREENYWREIADAFRNRREKGRSAATLTGIRVSALPWVDDPDVPFAELRERRSDPGNYENVSVRGTLVTTGDVSGLRAEFARRDPAELLRFLAGYLREHPECLTV